MNLTKSILSLSMLASIVAPASLQALSIPAYITPRNTALFTVAAAFSLASGRLFWKDPKPDAKPRYDLKKLYDVEFAKQNPKAYLENYWLLIDDGLVGQYFKDKHMVWKPESGTIKQSRKAMPFGVMGWSYSYLKTQEKAAKFIAPIVGIYAAARLAATGELDKLMEICGYKEKKDKAGQAPVVDPALATALQQNADTLATTKAALELAKANSETNAATIKALEVKISALEVKTSALKVQASVFEKTIEALQAKADGAADDVDADDVEASDNE